MPGSDRFAAGRRLFISRLNKPTVTVMAERQERPGDETSPEAGHNAHPVEPAEGAREPGEDADVDLPPHPDEPAEGERG